jgi:O-antigen ligase
MLPLAALVIVFGLRWLALRDLRRGEVVVVVALIWMVVTATFGWSIDDVGIAGEQPWSKAAKQLLQWAFFVLAALAVARALEPGVPRFVERGMSLGLAVACLIAIYVALAGPGALPGLDTNASIASGSDELYLGHAFTGIARLRAPMPEPLMFGSYLLAVVPLVALAGFGRAGWSRWWRCSVALLGLACLFATWSRGAWLGGAALAGLLAVAWFRGRFGEVSRTRSVGVLAGASVAGLFGISVVLQVTPWEVPALLFDRLAQSSAGHDMSNMTRVWAWRAAVEMFLDAPFAGQGWGSFGFLFYEYAPGAASGAHFGWPVPNNLALLLLAETGLVGLVLWAAALVPALRPLWDPGRGVAALVGACAVAGVLVHFATFSQWNLPHVWLLFGLGLGLARSRGVRAPGEASCAS